MKKAEVKAYRQEYSRRPHVKQRVRDSGRQRLLAKYGLTEVEFAELLYEQNYRCAICRSPEWGQKGPHIDHDHITGKVRGLLCARCNQALGVLGDDADSLFRAYEYLRRSEQEQ